MDQQQKPFECPSGLTFVGIYIALIIVLSFVIEYLIRPVLSVDMAMRLDSWIWFGLSAATAVMALCYIDSVTTKRLCYSNA